MNFESMSALRTVSWTTFHDEMKAFVECYGTSLVKQTYANPVSGYKLGKRLAGVRHGELWKGHPEEVSRKEWLESLPDWAWNVKETEDWKAIMSERTKRQFASQQARDALSDRAKKQFESQEARDAVSERKKAMWANADEETRAEWSRKNSEAQNRPEVKAAKSEKAKQQFETQEARYVMSERKKAMWANADEETRAEWSQKKSEAQNRPEVKAAKSEKAKKQFESQEARDALSERAKAQAVREAAEGKKSLQERSREWNLEQQAVKMASLTSDKERERYQRKIDSEARKSARKKRQLDALRQVPGWEDAKQRDIPKARLAGVLPSID